jgi:hypothetical protein
MEGGRGWGAGPSKFLSDTSLYRVLSEQEKRKKKKD